MTDNIYEVYIYICILKSSYLCRNTFRNPKKDQSKRQRFRHGQQKTIRNKLKIKYKDKTKNYHPTAVDNQNLISIHAIVHTTSQQNYLIYI